MIEEKDIDLTNLMNRFKIFISTKIYTLIISLVLVLIGIYTLFIIEPKEYSSKIVISSYQYPYSISNEILSELVEAIYNDEEQLLNSKLGIQKGDISPIKDMSLSEVIIAENNEIKSAISIVFTLQANDNRVRLDTVIANFMNNVDFVKKTSSAKRRSLENYISNIQGQIRRLDSTQLYLIDKLSSSSQNISIENYDFGSIYQQMIFLDKELNSSIEHLDKLVEFKVVSYIEVTSKSHLLKYLNIGVITWTLFLMFLFVRHIW